MPKLGDINPETGLIFWSKSHNWLTKEQFASYRASKDRAAKKFRERHPNYGNEQYAKHKHKWREYYLRNRDKKIRNSKMWAIKNPERKLEICKRSYSKRLKTNNVFRLRVLIGNRVKNALRRRDYDKNESCIKIVGCSAHDLRRHIESQFKPGMSWDNHGLRGWHVDHIIPLAIAKTQEEMESLCHYTNLQPLWAKDNLSKGGKLLSA